MRWTGRILLGLGVLGLVVAGVVILIFSGWKKDRVAALEAGSQVVETRLGDVEYSDDGNGPVVLVLHGAPGGYDQGRLIGRSLVAAGFRVIAPSRPGYLRTPLVDGMLFPEQADVMAALLEKLGIERVAVLGVSAGANVAVAFAEAQAAKTAGLVLISPITKVKKNLDEQPMTEELLEDQILQGTTGDMGTWWAAQLAARAPKSLLSAVLARDTKLSDERRREVARGVVDDAGRLNFFQELVESIGPLSGRESGTRNDLLMVNALQVTDYGKLALPILVVSGKEVVERDWSDSSVIVGAAPRAEALEVTDAGRLVWLSPEAGKMDGAIAAFLRKAFGGEQAE